MLAKALWCVAAFGLLLSPLVAGFGLSVSGNNWVVDTSGGLVFTVNSANGDITSILFNNLQAQDPTKFSQISSGLGSASCSHVQTGTGNNFIKISCVTSTLTQYYVAQNGVPAIHMGTLTTAEPTVGELRFIARLLKSSLPNGNPASDIQGGTAIEGSDVFLVNGQTRSKFYSSVQFIHDQVHGATGSGIGAFMIIPGTGYEASSGGPFFRDIDNQGSDQQEVYFYMNSGHTQTEADRQGFHGPYALWFTTGSTPGVFDTSFWSTLGVSGFVPTSSRGFVNGKAIGIPSAFSGLTTVGWANSAAQYWAAADASTGDFSSPAMISGTYTMSLYKRELVVGTQSVTVSAGTTINSNIHDTFALDTLTPIWSVGDFDGTPTGFLNADMIQTIHPSDSRMHSWGPITYTVGQQAIGFFPMTVFQAIGPVTVRFGLASGQGGARTLRIATSLAFAGGRPVVTINGFSGPVPPAPNEPDSRGVTRGTWRGNNQLYEVDIPSGVLTTGSTVNVMTITVASGSSGAEFLSPNFVVDAIALY
ncbi:polysaccharide lyase family 4 protein [Stereum hirsutum FP-91666 SS1]|uniref:polysaccharide lyase family 4 protein n=1 Tax=Stereum hirsutum (strain FP-91666) TaxID=721885 RepID=UPI000440DE20|nr:polysaccharide lyase family 4 protein [Stereum hirsutum FP-91666 SS1]EIM87220.1 polysaccharide lyase family 4 protein [Stereum hirsutum FP-91666 SS1]